MTIKKPCSKKNELSSKVKSSTKTLSSQNSYETKTKNFAKKTILPRSKLPDVSVVNVIEQVSKLLREEFHSLQKKKASGE